MLYQYGYSNSAVQHVILANGAAVWLKEEQMHCIALPDWTILFALSPLRMLI